LHFAGIKTHLQSLLLCVMQPFHDVPSHFGRDVSGGALPGDSLKSSVSF